MATDATDVGFDVGDDPARAARMSLTTAASTHLNNLRTVLHVRDSRAALGPAAGRTATRQTAPPVSKTKSCDSCSSEHSARCRNGVRTHTFPNPHYHKSSSGANRNSATIDLAEFHNTV
eukprot:m.104548 g.104548  ORF g.104548 m.104548 type:complete len:119 (+) comp12611_c0_seq2:2130-2486(+)